MLTTLDFNKLTSKDPKVKYGFTKELLRIGASNPDLLYAHIDLLTNMLTSENNILKWTAIDLIGYLSSVDKDHKTDNCIKDLIVFLHGGKLITCNHAIFALGLIAQNKPEYRTKILQELLAISDDEFETEECKNIATGKVLDAIKPLLGQIKSEKEVIAFIQLAAKNTRNATKKRADKLLKLLEK